jgi:hypothetical protein
MDILAISSAINPKFITRDYIKFKNISTLKKDEFLWVDYSDSVDLVRNGPYTFRYKIPGQIQEDCTGASISTGPPCCNRSGASCGLDVNIEFSAEMKVRNDCFQKALKPLISKKISMFAGSTATWGTLNVNGNSEFDDLVDD